MKNFKRPFIQEKSDGALAGNRSFTAEICWYGVTDNGLVDVRPTFELWGLDAEVKRWRELRLSECNAELSNLEISEMVLAEDWPARLKETHIKNINDVTS